MSFNPNTFYIGIIDLFAILLPGAIVVLALNYYSQSYVEGFLQTNSNSSFYKSFLLLFGSYLFGHIVSQLSAYFDAVYDWNRKRTIGKDKRLKKVKEIRVHQYGNNKEDMQLVNTFDWSVYKLQLEFPTAIEEIERYTADSKFFRGLFLIMAIMMIVLLIQGQPLPALNCLFLATFSCMRYFRKRDKAISTAYKHVIFIEELHTKNASQQK